MRHDVRIITEDSSDELVVAEEELAFQRYVTVAPF